MQGKFIKLLGQPCIDRCDNAMLKSKKLSCQMQRVAVMMLHAIIVVHCFHVCSSKVAQDKEQADHATFDVREKRII